MQDGIAGEQSGEVKLFGRIWVEQEYHTCRVIDKVHRDWNQDGTCAIEGQGKQYPQNQGRCEPDEVHMIESEHESG